MYEFHKQLGIYAANQDRADSDRRQIIHDAKWQGRMENFEALIKALSLSVIILAAIWILIPAVWALLSPFHRGLAVGVFAGVPLGIFIVGLCRMAREQS